MNERAYVDALAGVTDAGADGERNIVVGCGGPRLQRLIDVEGERRPVGQRQSDALPDRPRAFHAPDDAVDDGLYVSREAPQPRRHVPNHQLRRIHNYDNRIVVLWTRSLLLINP